MTEKQSRRRAIPHAHMPDAETVAAELAKVESMDDFFGEEGLYSLIW